MNNIDLSQLTPEDRLELEELLENPQTFCEAFFTYPSGPLAGQPFRANFPQQQIFSSTQLTTWICVHRRAGKMQPLYSAVHTPSGPRTMGSLCVGDVVSTPDGGTGKVLEIFPHGKQPIYRMWLDDGTYVDSGAEHLWEVYTGLKWAGGRGNSRKQFGNKVLTTQQILESLTYKYADREEYNYKLNPIKPVEYEKKSLPIEPYTLGVLLGDGHLPLVVITSADSEIINQVSSRAGYTLKVHQKFVGSPAVDYKITDSEVKDSLKSMGLSECRSHTKFIPQEYKYSSVEDRLWLLRGLMDTDGSSDKRRKGQAEFCSVSKQLAEDVADLARSLGCKVTLKASECGYRKSGERIVTGTRYRLTIRVPEGLEIFSLSRKQCGGMNVKYLRRTIVKCEKLEEQTEMQCISIDHPQHLYITDNWTPTHNSYSMTLLALYYALTQEKKQILVFAPSQPQILEFFRVLDEWIDNNDYLMSMIDKAKPNRDSPYPQRSFLTGSSIVGHVTGLKEGTQQGKRGLTADMVFLDEAQEFSLSDWRVVQAIIGGDFTRLGTVRTFIAGTVRAPEGHFYDKVKQLIPLEENELLVHMPITENEDYTDEQRRLLRAQTTEEVWRTEYLLEVGEGSNTVFRVEDVDAACVEENTRVVDPRTGRPTPIKDLDGVKCVWTFDFKSNTPMLVECWWFKSGVKPCLKLTTHTGKKHRVSEDHQFFVHGRGWTHSVDIKLGDKLLAVDSYPDVWSAQLSLEQAKALVSESPTQIPDPVFVSNHQGVSNYIRALWEWTGRIFNTMGTMGFMGLTEPMARDLQHLLQRLGVESRVHQNNLFVDDQIDQRILLNLVGVPCEVYDVRSPRRWETVIEIMSLGERPVYDISVRHEDHNFLIADTVVHNCTHDWELGNQWIDWNPVTNQQKTMPRFIGVDWDKSGAGAHIAVIQYDVESRTLYTIDHYEVPRGKFTFYTGSDRVLDMTGVYAPYLVVSDGGAGEMQWEYMYLESEKRGGMYSDRIEKRYFQESLIVTNPKTGEEEKKRLKPVLVGLMQKKLQERKWYFPAHLRKLEEQLKVYEAKTTDAGNVKYFSKEDHIIDCHLFALWGVWSLFEDPLSDGSALDMYYAQVSVTQQSALMQGVDGDRDKNLFGFREDGFPHRTNLWEMGSMYEPGRRLDIGAARGDLYGF